MEWIGIGIMVAIGFYLAPLVLTIIAGVIIGVVGIIGRIFGGRR